MPPFAPAAVIGKKRDGLSLTDDEIRTFINGYKDDKIPDYQMSALAMAILLQGMNEVEIACLTHTMLHSGIILQWPNGSTPQVDKHSTGGIGDKSSLILAPLLACCDLQVPMISGRGLGATGGTLDKLEAIPGFRTDLSVKELQDVVDRVGCVITGASAELAPADKKLYALRDVSGTVPSIALITASIMSKKLAENPKALVLDVKWGSGAFMKKYEDAKLLAQSMVNTGRQLNVATTALLTDMNQPNGRMAGNANEVIESINTLKGRGPADLVEVTFALGAELLISTGKAKTTDDACEIFQSHIDSGRAYEKFEQMIVAQGGDPKAKLTVAPATEIQSNEAGYFTACNTEQLGLSIIELGGGRKVQGDKLDHSTGLEILVRLGDKIEKGQALVKVFAKEHQVANATEMVRGAFTIGNEKITPPKLIAERI